MRSKITAWLSKDGASNQWSKYIMWAPDLFYLLWKLSTDPDVPKAERAKLIAAIAYFISPIDFFPEAVLGPFGFADDIIVAALVLNGLINKTAADIVEKHWPGDDDVLVVIKKIISISDQLVSPKVLKKIRSIIK
ncbi:DUF1232 domain-containing protein [candidate division KSB1 bacterium]|nr:MAG: DUF1232 domain-containing protein [candidate division KSB1 bacterium]